MRKSLTNKETDTKVNEHGREGGRREGWKEKERKKNMKRAGEWEQIKERDGEGMERLDEKKCYER